MDERLRMRWTMAAAHVLALMERAGEEGPGNVRQAKASMVPMWKRLERALDANGLTWNAEVNATWQKGRFRSAVTDSDLNRADHDGRRMKALRAAWHLVSGSPLSVPRSERAVVASALDGIPGFEDGVAKLSDGPVGDVPPPVRDLDPGVVTFRYCRQQRPRSHVLVDGFGTHVVESVDEADAPVVARLATLDGPTVTLRKVGDAFVRPVMAPGSWEPLDLASFVRVAAEGGPWADDPFRAPLGVHRADVMAIDDLVTPGAARDRWAATMEDDAVRRGRAHAGRLMCIGGIVHRECPEPVLSTAKIHGDGREVPSDRRMVALGWRIGDQVDFASSPDHMRTVRHGPSWLCAASPSNRTLSEWCDLPISEHEVASEVFREVADRFENGPGTWRRPAPEGGHLSAFEPQAWVAPNSALLEIVRPDLLEPGTERLLRDLRSWSTIGQDGMVADAVRSRLDDSGTGPDVLADVAALVSGVERPTSIASMTAFGCFLRAAARMRVRDASPEVSAEDEDVVARFSP